MDALDPSGADTEDFTTFVLAEATGRSVQGQVSTSSLRVLYEAGLASALASHLFSGVGGSGMQPKSGLFFSIPFTLGLETLEAIKDVILKHSAHHHTSSADRFQVRVPHHVHGAQLFPFLKALDFLGLPIARNDLDFETVAVKWQYELVSQLEAMSKRLITDFLVPALLGKMSFWHLHQVAIYFGSPTSASVGPGGDVQWMWSWELARCPSLYEHVNLAVFASFDQTRGFGSQDGSTKEYRIYQLPDKWRSSWDTTLEYTIASKVVEATDDFDTKLGGLFAGRFEKTVLLNAIKSCSAFKGLKVDILEHLSLVLFTHTLEVEDL